MWQRRANELTAKRGSIDAAEHARLGEELKAEQEAHVHTRADMEKKLNQAKAMVKDLSINPKTLKMSAFHEHIRQQIAELGQLRAEKEQVGAHELCMFAALGHMQLGSCMRKVLSHPCCEQEVVTCNVLRAFLSCILSDLVVLS